MIFSKGKLDEIGRELILRLRIDTGCRSKQYSNAYHDGIVVMCKAFQKEITKHQEQEMLKTLPLDDDDKIMTYAKAGVDQHKEEQVIKSILLAIRSERKKMGKPIDDNQYPGMIEVG